MQWLDTVLAEEYTLVSILRNTERVTIRRLRHNRSGKDLVCLSFCGDAAVYRLLQKIRHENLPRIYETIQDENGCTILEEYIDGTTVADILQSGVYTPEGAVSVLSAVCDAVGVLHSQGFIHRDIKPENVMITAEGRVVLLDFDTSRHYCPERSGDTAVIGTAGYAAPEQFGISQSDTRSDIYAMGIMLNVMLTGKHPSKATAKGKLWQVIEKCTRIDPKQRYRTVWELKKELAKY